MVTLPQHPEANQVLGEVATDLNVRGVSAASYVPPIGTVGHYVVEVLEEQITVDSPLVGDHQHRNVALAIATAAELAAHHSFPVTPASIAEGIRQTHWPGRLERIERAGSTWILDVAHNPAGAWALRSGLHALLGERRPGTLIFSCLRDKPVAEMAQILFPLFDGIILVPIHSSRAAAMDELTEAAKATGTHAMTTGSVQEAIALAEAIAGETVVISGSVYLVGEARALLMGGHGAHT